MVLLWAPARQPYDFKRTDAPRLFVGGGGGDAQCRGFVQAMRTVHGCVAHGRTIKFIYCMRAWRNPFLVDFPSLLGNLPFAQMKKGLLT
jgi:hypothetical protein